MQSLILRTRFPLVAAVSLALFVGGLASGSAGSPFVLGRPNSAGTETTQLGANTASGPIFLVQQEGSGTALRAEAHVGIAGFFSSGNGAGVSGVTGHSGQYGVYAGNDSEERGSGGALRAKARSTAAIVATSDEASPMVVGGPDDQPPFVLNSSVMVENLNADSVDGWSVKCPPGTTWSAGLCIETSARSAASVLQAADTCSSAAADDGDWHFRLPTALQLRAAVRDGLEISASGEHTDSLHGADDGLSTLVVTADGELAVASAADEYAYRCAASPLWPDVSMDTGG